MENKIVTEYLNKGARVRLSYLNTSYGIFTIAEKYFDQLRELYEENKIDLKEFIYHLRVFFTRGRNMKTNLIGRLSFYYYMDMKSPYARFTLLDNLTFESVRFSYFSNVGLHSFVGVLNNEQMALCGFLLTKGEALSFLEYLERQFVVNKKQAEELEYAIENSKILDGNKLSLMN